MNTKGVWIACLYSLNCPELLNKENAQKSISEFIKHPKEKNIVFVKEILEKLEPFLFYQLIASQSGIVNPFGEEVVRAYWLGNDLLKTITQEDVTKFLTSAFIPETHRLKLLRIVDLIDGKPHHNWQILSLIKGKIRKREDILKQFLVSFDNCLVKAGEITWFGDKTVQVKTKKLSLKGKEIILEDAILMTERGFHQITEGDFVSIHLSQVKEKINKETFRNLSEITQEAISFLKE